MTIIDNNILYTVWSDRTVNEIQTHDLSEARAKYNECVKESEEGLCVSIELDSYNFVTKVGCTIEEYLPDHLVQTAAYFQPSCEHGAR